MRRGPSSSSPLSPSPTRPLTRSSLQAERRLRFLTQQIAAQDIHIRPYEETLALLAGRSGPQALDELDARLSESEQRVVAMNTSYENLEKRALELEEARQVLRETDAFFAEAKSRSGEIRTSFEEQDAPLLGDVEANVAAAESGFGGFELEFVPLLPLFPSSYSPSFPVGSSPVPSTVLAWAPLSVFSGASSVVTST